MISKKKFGTTVTAFGVAAGMLLGSAAPAHAEETAKTVQETQKDQADALATQSETENGNTEEAVVPAVETSRQTARPSPDLKFLCQVPPIKGQTPRTEPGFPGSGCLSGDGRILLFQYQKQSRQNPPAHDFRAGW